MYSEYATAIITGCFQSDMKDLLLSFVMKSQKNVIYSNLSDSRYIFLFLFDVFLIVHHSKDLFHLQTLMHNSIIH